jgi:hypothetical protein
MVLVAILSLCSILFIGFGLWLQPRGPDGAPPGDGRSGSRSWESEPRVVERVRGLSLEELAQATGFEVLTPAYLPPNLNAVPNLSYLPELGQVDLAYHPLGNSGPEVGLVLRVSETLDPTRSSCPPCASGVLGLDERSVSGQTVLVERSTQDRPLGVVAYFWVSDVSLTITFRREGQDQTGPPSIDELEAEALRVAQSIIRQTP